MNIKLEKTNDVETVFQIINKCSLKLKQEGLSHWKNHYTKKMIDGKIIEGQFYIIKDNIQEVGVVHFSNHIPEFFVKNGDGVNGNDIDYSVFFSKAENPVYLSAFGILPQFQKRGYGTKSLRKIIQQCKTLGYDYIRMDVRYTRQEYLSSWYEKFGFKKVGELKGKDKYYIYEIKL